MYSINPVSAKLSIMASTHRKEIIRRIQSLLAEPMSARGVRDMLIDTRILLESTGKKKDFIILKFYCDWVLHSEMTGATAKQILEDVDDVLYKWRSQQAPMPQDFEDTIGYKIGFYGFEEELQAFLKSLGVELARPGHSVNWSVFESLYGTLVTHCHLRYTSKKTLKLIHTAHVEIGHEPDSQVSVKWTFEGDGMEIFRITKDTLRPEDGATAKSDSSQLIVRRRTV
jgi:hypothetical protein